MDSNTFTLPPGEYEFSIMTGRRAGKTMWGLKQLLRLNNMGDLVGKYATIKKYDKNYLVKIDRYKGFMLTGIVQANTPEIKLITFHYNNIQQILPEGDVESLRLLYGEVDDE